tara:strand:+ start:78 stop:464 length:387 start_codon:yes stop_codon:yes gene_type:complete
MGLLGAIGIAGLMGKKSKSGGQSDTSKPLHTHSKKAENNTNAVAAGSVGASPPPPSNNPSDLLEPSFMGKGQVEQFSSLTDTSSVDRGGRAMSPDTLDPVGIKPAMNPPMATPIKDVDREGTMNALYS